MENRINARIEFAGAKSCEKSLFLYAAIERFPLSLDRSIDVSSHKVR